MGRHTPPFLVYTCMHICAASRDTGHPLMAVLRRLRIHTCVKSSPRHTQRQRPHTVRILRSSYMGGRQLVQAPCTAPLLAMRACAGAVCGYVSCRHCLGSQQRWVHSHCRRLPVPVNTSRPTPLPAHTNMSTAAQHTADGAIQLGCQRSTHCQLVCLRPWL